MIHSKLECIILLITLNAALLGHPDYGSRHLRIDPQPRQVNNHNNHLRIYLSDITYLILDEPQLVSAVCTVVATEQINVGEINRCIWN